MKTLSSNLFTFNPVDGQKQKNTRVEIRLYEFEGILAG